MKLHIGNLPKNMTDPELKALITPFAEPASVEIIKNTDGTSKGFAFAEFAEAAHANVVITGLNGKDLGGQSLRVSEARPRKGDKPSAPLA